MDNNQIKTNAVISYMFLGWLFLMAKANPNFNHEFIRKHAMKATKIHAIFLVIFISYNLFLSGFLNINIPFLLISIDKIINLIIFAILTISILKWCYRAHKWLEPENISFRKIYSNNSTNYEIKNIWESEKMLYLWSFLPFLWIISAKNYENDFTKIWVKIWSILTFLICLCFVLNWFGSIFLISLFLYILIIVYYWVNIFINDSFSFPSVAKNIPSLKFLVLFIKAWFFYCIDFLKMIFWKNKTLDFKWKILEISRACQEDENLLRQYYTDEKLIISKKLIFIPIINLLFLPTIFKNNKSKYFLAIIQWNIISIIIILIWYFFWFRSELTIFMLFPVFLWIANIDSNPFYRIPILFEIYKILNILSFWLFSKFKHIREKNIDSKEVKFKV